MEVFLRKVFCTDCGNELITNHREHDGEFLHLVPLLDEKLYRCGEDIERFNELKEVLYGADSSCMLGDVRTVDNLKLFFAFNEKPFYEYGEFNGCSIPIDKRDFNLTNGDYITIANIKYPGKYDRVLVSEIELWIKSKVVISFNCEMVVGSDVTIKTHMSYDELVELQERNDIQIVRIYSTKYESETKEGFLLEYIQDSNKFKWMSGYSDSGNQWFECFISYLKNTITLGFIKRCIDTYIQYCIDILMIPDDASMDRAIKSYGYGSYKEYWRYKEEDIAELRDSIKTEAQNNGFDKAVEIIKKYSRNYKRIMVYAQKNQ